MAKAALQNLCVNNDYMAMKLLCLMSCEDVPAQARNRWGVSKRHSKKIEPLAKHMTDGHLDGRLRRTCPDVKLPEVREMAKDYATTQLLPFLRDRFSANLKKFLLEAKGSGEFQLEYKRS